MSEKIIIKMNLIKILLLLNFFQPPKSTTTPSRHVADEHKAAAGGRWRKCDAVVEARSPSVSRQAPRPRVMFTGVIADNAEKVCLFVDIFRYKSCALCEFWGCRNRLDPYLSCILCKMMGTRKNIHPLMPVRKKKKDSYRQQALL